MNELKIIQDLVEKNKYSQALAELDRLIEAGKDNQDAHIFKARLLQLMNRDADAIKLYEEIISKFPQNIDAYLDLIEILSMHRYSNKETYDKVIELGKKVKLIDKIKAPYFHMAKTYQKSNQFDLAIETYDKAIKQKAIEIKASALIANNKKYDQDIIDQAISDITENRQTLYNAFCEKAKCLHNTGKFQEAIDTYTTAIQINASRKLEFESYAEYDAISKIYSLLGDEEKAKSYEDKARRLEKIDNDAYARSQGRATEDEFDTWFNGYFDVDKTGKIIGVKEQKSVSPKKNIKNKEISKSYIRSWADSRRKELESSDEFTVESLFAGLMYGLATFAKADPRRKKTDRFIDVTKHYSNDSSLFEVGCYLYFRVDLWLFKNKPNLREIISTVFIREFNKLFSEALGISSFYLHELFQDRVAKYGELIRKGEEIKNYHFYLSQLILYTKDGAIPGKHNLNKMRVLLSLFDDFAVKLELIAWEKSIVPSIIGSLEKYCSLLEKKG